MGKSNIPLDRDLLSKMSKDELLAIARKLNEHKEAQQYAKGDIYLDNAHEKQILFHQAKNRVRIFFGGNRCLAEGTLIATPRGPKPIEDIEIGDTVYDENGGEIKVKKVFYNGIKEVADVTNRGRVIATCTGDHTWLTSTWRSKLKECAAKDFSRDTGIEKRTFKCSLGEVRQPHAYAIGALLGDGCGTIRGKKIHISSPDNKVPAKVANILGATYDKLHKKNFTYRINQEHCLHYSEWIRGRYSHEKTVDLDLIREWDRLSLIEFVAGVFDTDGSLTVTPERIRFSIAMQAKPVIDAISYAFLALWQIKLNFRVDTRDKYVNGPVYEVACQNALRLESVFEELNPHLVSDNKKWETDYTGKFGKRTRNNAVGATWGKNKRLRKTYDIHVDSPTNLYCLANGLVTHNSGKTTAGTNEIRWRTEGTHPFNPVRTPIKACIVLQDFTTHGKDVIEPKIKEWFPPGLVTRTEKNQQHVIVKYHLRNGSTIDVKSHDQDIKVFEGSDYDFIWFDEPPPQAIFKALWRGLTDRRGSCIITGTPITEPWLYDLYQKAAAKENRGTYWAIFAEMDENAKNIGEGDIEEGRKRIQEFLEAIDDPDEREAREKGRFLHMKGIIFKSWNRGLHLIEPFKWPNHWPIYITLDPHPRKPWGLAFVGVTSAGFKILLSSYKVEGVVEDVAEHILYAKDEIPMDRIGRPRIASCWIDNYASVESMIKRSTTILQELNSYVVPTIPSFRPAPKNVDEKISLFKSWLKPEETKYGQKPAFMVFDTPENRDFVYEIEHYVWARGRGTRRLELKNTPEKENDDILAAVMQLALVLDSKKGHTQAKERPRVIKYAGGYSR